MTFAPLKLRALTVWQPWASLIIGGWKPYEFRPRPAPASLVGKHIVIHAARRPVDPKEISDLLRDLTAGVNCGGLSPNCGGFLLNVLRDPGRIPYGAGLGTVKLGKPALSSELWPGEFANDSDRLDKANWAWPLSEVRRWPHPVPARGYQGHGWPWVHGVPA